MDEEKILTELVRLLNKRGEGYEIDLLIDFADWVNDNSSSYNIIEHPENYGECDMWVLEKKI